MTTSYDGNGNLIYGVNNTDIISNSDMNSLKNFYIGILGGFPSPNSSTVYIDHFLNVINYIDNFLNTNPYTLDYDLWNALKARLNSNSRGTTIGHDYVWPKLLKLNPRTFTFDASHSFVVPMGTNNITINYLIGGGGGGAAGSNWQYGHYCGGGGGAGGYYTNVNMPVTHGNTVDIVIGPGGVGANRTAEVQRNGTNGGNSSIAVNGSVLYNAGGGGGANGTGGGGGGSPNGQGGGGCYGIRHKKEAGGACGGASILGYRACGNSQFNSFTNADSYRGGGGGGGEGISDHQDSYTCPGGYGGNGFAQLTFYCLEGWNP